MELNIRLDPAGFPTIFVKEINAYMQWLPTTKIQIEYFLCKTTETTYDDTWYQGVLSLNPRISPGNISAANYWEAIATGVKPRDAMNYARWCREAYTLPDAKEWYQAYEALLAVKESPSHVEQILSVDGLNPRAKILIQNIEYATQQKAFELDTPRSLADQMLMRLGVMEFVYNNQSRTTYGGYGQTSNAFYPQMEVPRPDAPQSLSNARDGAQLRQYGFRLINRRS
jgi:hypothetical protein